MGKPTLSNEILVQPQVLIKPFEKWELYFVGPINPPSMKISILVCTDYVAKWVECKELPFSAENVIVSYMFLGYFYSFWCSKRNCNRSRNTIHIEISVEACG